MLSPNFILQNRYRIVRLLGEGGMGAVYEAIDQRVSCVVALKETRIGNESEARRAFEREAALLANLRHPVLPKVMDYFSEDAGEYLIMEFIPGHDLAELLQLRDGPFQQAEVIQWADTLLKCLDYLHSRQPPIVHRDIKPSNLKVTRQRELFLLDFGLAKGAAGQMSTLEGSKSVLGYTPVYAPLEQIHGRGTDPRSDLYALGATLYHLLTGCAPVDAPTRFVAIDEEQPDPLPPVRSLNPNVTVAVSEVIEKAMSISRRQRPSSAAEMRSALIEASEEKPSPTTAEDASTLKFAEQGAKRLAEPRSTVNPVPEREPPKAPPPTAASPTKAAKPAEAPPIQTMKVPEIPKVKTDPIPGLATAGLPAKPKSRTKMIGIAFVAAILVLISIPTIGFVIYLRSGQTTDNASPTQPASIDKHEKPSAPAPTPPAGMAYIPGGEFTMGRDDGDEYERPAHKVTVNPFFMDLHEVTLKEFGRFDDATKHRYSTPDYIAAIAFDPKLEKYGNNPITHMSWDVANAYAKWAGKRLPTEEEWEFAARGTDARHYPWGNDWRAGLANADSVLKSVANVGFFKGTSPYGLVDMVGNAWEWTASPLTTYPGGQLPIKPTDDLRVIRGGAYDSDQNTATTTYRRGYPARGNYDYTKTGFRCAKDVR